MGADRRGDKGKSKGKGGHGAGKQRYADVRDLPHAFKVLCPEELIGSLMGHHGAAKDQIQEETGARLVVSQRNEHFPGTRFRILIAYHENADGVVMALDRIIDRLVECGEREAQNAAPQGEPEFLGRETGEFVFRGAISPRMSGAIIGPKGARVQQMREQSNARVSIDKDVYQGHQMVKVIAQPDGIRAAVAMINECVQEEAGSEWFAQWALASSFVDGQEDGWGKGHEKGKGKERSRSPRRERGGHNDWGSDGRGGYEQQGYGGYEEQVGYSPGPDAWNTGGPPAHSEDDGWLLNSMATTIGEFPPNTLELEYSITCDLPVEKVSGLIGKSGANISEVRRITGTKIHFEEAEGEEPQQTLLIQGPLLNVYRAHALMMRRYHEMDLKGTGEVSDLKNQLEALQRQLESVTPKGKGKGKGKGKK